MGLKDTIMDWLTADGGEEGKVREDGGSYQRDYQGTALDRDDIDAFIMIFRPKRFTAIEEVCRYLRSGKAVIVNMEEASPEDAQRMIDYLSGVVMAKDGSITRIVRNIYMCTPNNIGVVEQ